jgi:hypothetical protein
MTQHGECFLSSARWIFGLHSSIFCTAQSTVNTGLTLCILCSLKDVDKSTKKETGADIWLLRRCNSPSECSVTVRRPPVLFDLSCIYLAPADKFWANEVRSSASIPRIVQSSILNRRKYAPPRFRETSERLFYDVFTLVINQNLRCHSIICTQICRLCSVLYKVVKKLFNWTKT